MSAIAGRTRGMTSFLIHGLWRKESGLHLWIEQVEGHRIVTPDAVPEGTFPPIIEALIAGKEFNHRAVTSLMTPKGRSVTLPLPTIAYTPEQAVRVLSQVAGINSVNASAEQLASIAPDLKWLVHLCEGLERFVLAGRVTLKMGYVDHQWWPQWQLATGLGERGFIANMTTCAPGVLTVNGGTDIAEVIAEELVHWIACAHLREFYDTPRSSDWHDFSRALMLSEPLRRGSAQMVAALNAWKDSITAVDIQLVLIVEEPPKDIEVYDVSDAADMVWPVRVKVRSGVDSPQTIILTDFDRITRERLVALRREAIFASKLLDSDRPLTDTHPANGTPMRHGLERTPQAGEWDVYLSTEELVKFVAEDAARLRDRGFSVMLPRAWSTQETKATVVVGEPTEASTGAKIGLEQIVQYNWRVSIGDVELTDEEMEQLVQSKSGLIQLRGAWVMADTASVKRIADYMGKLSDGSKKKRRAELDAAMMEAELARVKQTQGWEQKVAHAEDLAAKFNADFHAGGEISLAQLRELALEALADEPVEFEGNNWQAGLLGGLQGLDMPAPTRVELPDTVNATLREYQRRGVDWLHWMSNNNLGAVLADDMGLGKTLQLLSLEAVDRSKRRKELGLEPGQYRMAGTAYDVVEEKSGVLDLLDNSLLPAADPNEVAPTLVVAPTSVVGNWAREAAKFVPSFGVLVHHGSGRLRGNEFIEAAKNSDIVITSYGTMARDHQLIRMLEWDRVVLDEAQQIKNSSTKVSKAVRSTRARHRVALTGTPVENRLSEMRSILDFCNPGVLGSSSFFRNHFAKAIEREQDEQMTERLRQLTAPFILRRLKTDEKIVDDLPDKTEVILTVDMTPEQAALYRAYVNDMQAALEDARGMAKRGLVLAALTKIKQICNHPAHFLGDASPITLKGRHRSGKVAELMRLIGEAQDSGQRMLIFTQYRAFGDILAPFLTEYFGTRIPFLHGGVSKTGRDRMVEEFQREDGPPAMVLSLKAGGTGLNLTAASIVVHMDRWWNPAVENQATDRAFRIGQRKDVSVYKMITAGTMEESIQDILDGKTQLATAVVGEGEGWITELSTEELAMLMSYRGNPGV